MKPFAVFSLHDELVRMPAERGAALGIWLVKISITTTHGALQKDIKTRQPCTFEELRDQLLTTEINELFDDIEANADEHTINASFTVYKLRAARGQRTCRVGRNPRKTSTSSPRASTADRRTRVPA